MSYAAAFEMTFADDDWSRLEPHFASAAVYEVRGLDFDCRLEGPTAIFAGLKKSLDGFDRRLETRVIELTSAPTVDGDSFSVEWAVTYTKQGMEPFILRGTTEARLGDGKITWLRDSYSDEMSAEGAKWLDSIDFEIQGAYV